MADLPELIPNRLALLVQEDFGGRRWPLLIARLALTGPLRVVDAGNCFAAYAIVREIRRAALNPKPALKRIWVSRAFTCYQALALLEETPDLATPFLVLEMLSTFHDENVHLAERRRLLLRCTQELRRLSRQASVGVMVTLRPKQPDTPLLLAILEEAADQVWHIEAEQPVPPPRLF